MKFAHFSLSWVGSIILLFMCGCSAKTDSSLQEFVSARQSEQLLAHAEVRNSHLRGYVFEVSNRLGHFSRASFGEPRIIVSPIPLALITAQQQIILSTTLLRTVESEAELAFVLCHEYAHKKLGHTPKPLTGYLSDRSLQDEIAADRAAVECLLRSFYDPHEALQILPKLKFYSQEPLVSRELTERITHITPLLQQLPRQQFAFRPQRRFSRFQRLLQGVQ